jgi:hypothetical protein
MFTAGIHEQFIDINRHAPRADAKFPQECIQPVGAASGLAVTICRPEQLDIGLASQVFGASIGRVVVHDEESIDAQAAIVPKKSRQTKDLVSAPRERANLHGTRRPMATGRVFDENVTSGRL